MYRRTPRDRRRLVNLNKVLELWAARSAAGGGKEGDFHHRLFSVFLGFGLSVGLWNKVKYFRCTPKNKTIPIFRKVHNPALLWHKTVYFKRADMQGKKTIQKAIKRPFVLFHDTQDTKTHKITPEHICTPKHKNAHKSAKNSSDSGIVTLYAGFSKQVRYQGQAANNVLVVSRRTAAGREWKRRTVRQRGIENNTEERPKRSAQKIDTEDRRPSTNRKSMTHRTEFEPGKFRAKVNARHKHNSERCQDKWNYRPMLRRSGIKGQDHWMRKIRESTPNTHLQISQTADAFAKTMRKSEQKKADETLYRSFVRNY